jgi:hypothetical protein
VHEKWANHANLILSYIIPRILDGPESFK